MRAAELRELLAEVLPRLAAHEDELRDLDAAIGDGDLGITVRAGSDAIVAAISALADDASVSQILAASGRAFATANPSTFAALVGGGLLAASKAVAATDSLDREAAALVLRAVIDRISERGGAQLGDKTVLDALVPTLDVLESADSAALGTVELAAVLRDVASAGVESTRELQSARGRAAWVGERSAGHADPGATAYTYLLAELTEVLHD